MNVFCMRLHNFKARGDPGKFMQTYWYRNNAKNTAISGPDSLIGGFYMKNFWQKEILGD